ncbi:hypothetical protein FI667_g4776, partial [Globisporangium splendens]
MKKSPTSHSSMPDFTLLDFHAFPATLFTSANPGSPPSRRPFLCGKMATRKKVHVIISSTLSALFKPHSQAMSSNHAPPVSTIKDRRAALPKRLEKLDVALEHEKSVNAKQSKNNSANAGKRKASEASARAKHEILTGSSNNSSAAAASEIKSGDKSPTKQRKSINRVVVAAAHETPAATTAAKRPASTPVEKSALGTLNIANSSRPKPIIDANFESTARNAKNESSEGMRLHEGHLPPLSIQEHIKVLFRREVYALRKRAVVKYGQKRRQWEMEREAKRARESPLKLEEAVEGED